MKLLLLIFNFHFSLTTFPLFYLAQLANSAIQVHTSEQVYKVVQVQVHLFTFNCAPGECQPRDLKSNLPFLSLFLQTWIQKTFWIQKMYKWVNKGQIILFTSLRYVTVAHAFFTLSFETSILQLSEGNVTGKQTIRYVYPFPVTLLLLLLKSERKTRKTHRNSFRPTWTFSQCTLCCCKNALLQPLNFSSHTWTPKFLYLSQSVSSKW